jgi:membrane fusion protein (multidrug efflux system)
MAPSLDETTRTRLVEARIANDDHAILPGMFADAALELPRGRDTSTVPGEAIAIRDGKQCVAEVRADETIHYVPVQIGRDTGVVVELLAGIAPGTRVAVNLSQQPPEGAAVRPVERAAK